MNYLITVYVPENALEKVKKSLFDKGAGAFGDYDSCSWQVKGQGQFRPLDNAQPAIGQRGTLSHVVEYRLDVFCHESCIKPAVAAMVAAHPYEQVAYHLQKIATLDDINQDNP